MTRLVCATHGHCFDGMASAALFTELAHGVHALTEVQYLACGYGPTAKPPQFDGEENALLDFRYHSAETLSYYFDHHTTAFVSEEDRAHFELRAQTSPDRFVWEPSSVSCAGLIVKKGRNEFGVEWAPHHDELSRWADKIDGARFSSAAEATDRTEPVMRLAAVVERFGDSRFLAEAVPLLRKDGVRALAASRFVKDHYRTIEKHFRAYEERVLESGQMNGRVAFLNMSDKSVPVISKFFHYKAYPEALYSVMVTHVGTGLKVSIGYNPWHGAPLDTDIGAICARHGGGGHPVVGAIGFPLDQTKEALLLAKEIADELNTPSSNREAPL